MRRWMVALTMALAWGAWAAAADAGALGSRSAHEADDAQEALEHEHGPRHGGVFGDAEDLYHYEVLLDSPNRLILYVHDERNRPLDVRELSGRWRLNPDEPIPLEEEFMPSTHGDYFFADLPSSPASVLHLEVEVLKDGRWIVMEFFLPRPFGITEE